MNRVDRELLAECLHEILRAHLEELVKGMPLKDGGLKLSGETIMRIMVLTRTPFPMLDPHDAQRARVLADQILARIEKAEARRGE